MLESLSTRAKKKLGLENLVEVKHGVGLEMEGD